MFQNLALIVCIFWIGSAGLMFLFDEREEVVPLSQQHEIVAQPQPRLVLPPLSPHEKIVAHLEAVKLIIRVRNERELAKAVYYLIRLSYREAIGEGEEGWALVVHNVLTRVGSDRFPDTIGEVIFQENPDRKSKPCEYDAVCDARGLYVEIPYFQEKEIAEVVDGVLAGEIPNPCPGALSYYNPKKVKQKPKWAFDDTFVARVGNHDCHIALPWDEYQNRLKLAQK